MVDYFLFKWRLINLSEERKTLNGQTFRLSGLNIQRFPVLNPALTNISTWHSCNIYIRLGAPLPPQDMRCGGDDRRKPRSATCAYLQKARAFGVQAPKPTATMLAMTLHTYRFCAGSLFGPA